MNCDPAHFLIERDEILECSSCDKPATFKFVKLSHNASTTFLVVNYLPKNQVEKLCLDFPDLRHFFVYMFGLIEIGHRTQSVAMSTKHQSSSAAPCGYQLISGKDWSHLLSVLQGNLSAWHACCLPGRFCFSRESCKSQPNRH